MINFISTNQQLLTLIGFAKTSGLSGQAPRPWQDEQKSWKKGLAPGQKPPNWYYTHSAHKPMTLAQLLIPLAILFSVSLVFFGMSGGYYDTDAYDGNGTAH